MSLFALPFALLIGQPPVDYQVVVEHPVFRNARNESRLDLYCCAFQPGTNLLAVGGLHGFVRLIDVDMPKKSIDLSRPLGAEDIHYLYFFKDKDRLLSGNGYGPTFLFDIKTGDAVRRADFDFYTSSLVVNDDETLFFASSSSRRKKVTTCWNISEWKESFQLTHDDKVYSSAALDSNKIVIAFEEGAVELWDVQRKSRLKRVHDCKNPPFNVKVHRGKRLVVVGAPGRTKEDGGGVLVYDTDLRLLKQYYRGTQVDISPDGEFLCVGSADGGMRLIHLESSREEPLASHKDLLWQVRFSPDGTRLLTACSDGTSRLYDVRRAMANLRNGR